MTKTRYLESIHQQNSMCIAKQTVDVRKDLPNSTKNKSSERLLEVIRAEISDVPKSYSGAVKST